MWGVYLQNDCMKTSSGGGEGGDRPGGRGVLEGMTSILTKVKQERGQLTVSERPLTVKLKSATYHHWLQTWPQRRSHREEQIWKSYHTNSILLNTKNYVHKSGQSKCFNPFFVIGYHGGQCFGHNTLFIGNIIRCFVLFLFSWVLIEKCHRGSLFLYNTHDYKMESPSLYVLSLHRIG